MNLPDSLRTRLEGHLQTTIVQARQVGGGCIARATRIETPDDSYFLKWGAEDVTQTFTAEANGLKALHQAASLLLVPEVVATESSGAEGPGFLLMTWIEQGSTDQAFWTAFGRGLAGLHRHTDKCFGFSSNNFIGRLPQLNRPFEDWPDFFRVCRLEPQIRMARDRGRWASGWTPRIDHILNRLDDWLPGRPPASMLHGDLWSGNVIPTSTGTAALIDPAVYYGHRETDLAYTELFGGFEPRFYEAYREAWPLEPEYDHRRDLYNLYHLLNHLNHFGGSYAGAVADVLRRYG